jgi:hypothetical protein
LHSRLTPFARGAVAIVPAFNSAVFAPGGLGRQSIIVLVLAGVAIAALVIAGVAFMGDRRRGSYRDDDIFTSPPIPMSKEDMARHARANLQHAFASFRIPRWVQAGSLLGALAITWVVAQRLEPGRLARLTTRGSQDSASEARGAADESPEDLDLAPDSAPAFSFRVQDWVSRGDGCAGKMEVTKGQPDAWTLTARVHDGQGQLIDTARARVNDLRAGEVIEFTFPRAQCDRIGAWDVRGARRR